MECDWDNVRGEKDEEIPYDKKLVDDLRQQVIVELLAGITGPETHGEIEKNSVPRRRYIYPCKW